MKNLFKLFVLFVLLSSCSSNNEDVVIESVVVEDNTLENGVYFGRAGEFRVDVIVKDSVYDVLVTDINENITLDSFTQENFHEISEDFPSCYNYCYVGFVYNGSIPNIQWDYLRHNKKIRINIMLTKSN